MSNEGLDIDFKAVKDSVWFNITEREATRSFRFGLGMYVSGQYFNKTKTQIESGTFAFVAADSTLYTEPWRV